MAQTLQIQILNQIKQTVEDVITKIVGQQIELSYPTFFENLVIFEIYELENRDQFNNLLKEYNETTIGEIRFSSDLWTIGNSNIYYTYSFDDSIIMKSKHGEYSLHRGEYIIVRVNMPIIVLGE